ncbi:hypothetical protein Q1695_012205 [Nippostrongylus brasiliensis]|nr:hypothetical protein Q1695_012205 [Nippostrongylus brasiliensis]
MLIVSAEKKIPFNDFEGMVKQLRSGSYRFLTPSLDWRPQCPPRRYSAQECATLFEEIFAKHPPVIAHLNQLANDTFVKRYSAPLVGVQWYEDTRLGGKHSVWTHWAFSSNVWVIRDFTVSPAAFPVSPKFKYLGELNSGIIEVYPFFTTVEHRYTPVYPKLVLADTPGTSVFTIEELSSVFITHIVLMLVALIVLVLEDIYAQTHQGRDVHSRSQASNSIELGMQAPGAST